MNVVRDTNSYDFARNDRNAKICRSGEEQSHKSPTPGGGPDEYHRAVKSILIYLKNISGI